MNYEKNHIKNADGLRGFACMAVFFSHVVNTFFPYMHGFEAQKYPFESYFLNSPFDFFYSGAAGVYVFFVLSGVVLSASFSKGFGLKKFSLFLIKRYTRLMVPVLASCIIGYVVYTGFKVNMSGISQWASRLGTYDYTLQGAIYDGTIGAFKDQKFSIYNWVLWTMRIEIIGSYLLAAFFVFKFSQISLLSLFTGVMLYIYGLASNGDNTFYGLGAFFIGSFFFSSDFRIGRKTAIALFIFGLYLAGVHSNSSWYQFFYGHADERIITDSIEMLGAIFIAMAALKSNAIDFMLSSKLAVFLGKISFSVYLTHLSFIYMIAIPTYQMSSQLVTPVLAALIAIVVCLSFTIIVSYGFYLLVDKKAVELSNYIVKRYKAAPGM
ncbi:acyltransferase [Kluyvera cryocrescens]|uniref:acyltransferase family protein n=1 Tax=Kluyvera cryocrescens TaxID=580 RepID=UPI002DBE5158|nr:acyltransferase [Kluyvera cryocrescens]MEB7559191.1 acyltransferase [Kluyvera cryocrescens]